jgi:riboflavin synthase
MFSGIIAAVGKVSTITPTPGGLRVAVDAGGLDLADVAIGDSIAVNGVCLTAVALGAGTFEADVSRETLSSTAGFAAGAPVNLEKALRLSDRLGGHLVSGHVDGVGVVARVSVLGDNRLVAIVVPGELSRYVARKGSIAVDGVSLTVNEIAGAEFAVNLIPHTLAATSLGTLARADRVNIEVDLLARYIERLSQAAPSDPPSRA